MVSASLSQYLLSLAMAVHIPICRAELCGYPTTEIEK